MSQRGSSRHDSGLVDGHGVLGIVRHDGVAGLVVGCDGLVLLIDLHTPSLRTWSMKKTTRQSLSMKYMRILDIVLLLQSR